MLGNRETWTHSPLERVAQASFKSCFPTDSYTAATICAFKTATVCVLRKATICAPIIPLPLISMPALPPHWSDGSYFYSSAFYFGCTANQPMYMPTTKQPSSSECTRSKHKASFSATEKTLCEGECDWVISTWSKQDNTVGQPVPRHSVIITESNLCPSSLFSMQTPFLQWKFLKYLMKSISFKPLFKL